MFLRGVARGWRGQKGCDQNEGSQERCGARRVTIELARGGVLYPPVMASVEAPYDIKEGRMIGVMVQSPLEFFSTTPCKY